MRFIYLFWFFKAYVILVIEYTKKSNGLVLVSQIYWRHFVGANKWERALKNKCDPPKKRTLRQKYNIIVQKNKKKTNNRYLHPYKKSSQALFILSVITPVKIIHFYQINAYLQWINVLIRLSNKNIKPSNRCQLTQRYTIQCNICWNGMK